ncbi:MAG: ABC transporter ATP-binding protein [bacterium]|nr:ABC transporter ATP-binding protein [bacterium]
MLPQRKFLSRYWKNERGTIAAIFTFIMLAQGFSLLEPYLWTRLLDGFLKEVTDRSKFPTEEIFFGQVTGIVLFWIAAALASRTAKNIHQFYATTLADRVGIRVFLHAFSHVLDLPMRFHANVKGGELFRKLTKARTDVTAFLTTYFEKIFQNAFAIALVAAYTFIRNWRMGLALVIFIPPFLLVTALLTRRIRRIQNRINKANETLFGTTVEAITHIEVVKAFATASHEHRLASRDHRIAHAHVQERTRAYQILTFTQGTIINLARVTMIWYGALLLFRGQLSFGDLVLFNIFTFWVYQPLYELGEIYAKYQEGVNAVERLQTVLREPTDEGGGASAVIPEELRGDIEFRHVGFTYSDEQREVLRDVSFRVKPGQKLALVGMSGSGKTTVVKLLLRFFAPTNGQVLVDGRSLRDYDVEALRNRIGLVMQDNILFNMSLADNIRYGTFDATDEQVVAAARRAYLDDLVATLPDGYKTLVGERGIKLSGGERQRVAIARAIIKQPDILIFDEATSALDSRSEELIKRAILEVSAGVTTVTVAHRFATVMNADEILLFERGRIMERGTHDQLLKRHGRYRELFELQTRHGVSLSSPRRSEEPSPAAEQPAEPNRPSAEETPT